MEKREMKMKAKSCYETKESRLTLAEKIAEESFVLLKNENHFLPLKPGCIPVFGRSAYQPNLSGFGSGMSFRDGDVPSFESAFAKAGIPFWKELSEFYKKELAKEKPFDLFEKLKELEGTDLVASGMIYEIFGKYRSQREEPELAKALVKRAAEQSDTALFILGRNTGGEECDRRVIDDYELLSGERALLAQLCEVFSNLVIVLNINGLTDLSWISEYPKIKAVIYIGTPGERGPQALANILSGRVTPSGKLAFTVALSYQQYSTARNFTFSKDDPDSVLEYHHYGLNAAENGSTGFTKSPVTVYQEGLYMGYRYFDSFGCDVLYPFGYGLSYAEFSIQNEMVWQEEDQICIRADVVNHSQQYSGKEVVQAYVSAPQGTLDQPYQRLIGWEKTTRLLPGERKQVTIAVPIREFASFDENHAAWILESGIYYIRVGNSSRNTRVAAAMKVNETIVLEQTGNVLSLLPCNQGKIQFLTAKPDQFYTYGTENEEKQQAHPFTLKKENLLKSGKEEKKAAFFIPEKGSTPFLEVCRGNLSMKSFLSTFSDDELAAICVGYGSGLPFGGMGRNLPVTIMDENGNPLTTNTHKTGNMGYVSPAMPKQGIPSAFYKDGPASVGITAWPTAMVMACAFSKELLYSFGQACGYEAALMHADSWLAPALNLHRNPLGGRNFEYFSEDPLVTGICGLQISRGCTQNPGVTCCPKHFALNEQETYRHGSAKYNYDAVDSIVTERTARELYLKPFEMVIRDGDVRTVMTSFNKINGTFAGGNYDLCTRLLRDEWGYQGVVVTDWGDLDIVVDGADAVAAGNDVVMPGGPPVIAQIQKGLKENRVTREQLETAVSHLLYFVMRGISFREYYEVDEVLQAE